MVTTFELKHDECKDFKYFCNNMKRCCTFCGKWYRFDQKTKLWVKE